MATSRPERRTIRFGVFEMDFAAIELRKRGRKVKLQEQPFRVLALLLQRPGEVVTRDELQQELWPADTFVEFDHGLNTAIKKIRQALDDSPHNPRFIETLPRHGYRFIASVEEPSGAAVEGNGSPAQVEQAPAGVQPDAVGRWPTDKTRRRVLAVAFVSALVGAAIATILTVWLRSPKPVQEAPLRKFAFSPGTNVRDPVISPDGRHIAYVAQGKLWVWDLDQEEPRELAEAQQYTRPFWSPDSDFIGFAVGRELKKTPVGGGGPIRVCRMDSLHFRRGTWSPDGESIAFGNLSYGAQRLFIVPSEGGEAELLIKPETTETDVDYGSPYFPPDAEQKVLLFTKTSTPGESEMFSLDFGDGKECSLGRGFKPVYSPTGHVVYQSSGKRSGLWALPFSLKKLEPTGQAFPIAPKGRDASVSNDGTLVYVAWPGPDEWQLVLRDRKGNQLRVIGQPQQDMSFPCFSPDERRVAVTGVDNDEEDIWVHDVHRPVKMRLTQWEGMDRLATWSHQGHLVAFTSNRREGAPDIFVKPVDGSGEARPLLASPAGDFVNDWSADGRYLFFTRYEHGTVGDIWYLEQTGDEEYREVPFTQGPSDEWGARLSPDGRCVANLSHETGRFEAYVREFPTGEGKMKLSSRGAGELRWGKDGKELFYTEGGVFTAVPMETTPKCGANGPAQELFPVRFGGSFDVSSDGQRFVFPEPVAPGRPPTIRVVENWYAEFRHR